MRRINLPLILDTLFAALCAFLLFFTAIRYYTRSAYIALGFAICACLLFGSLCFLYLSRKQNKSLLISRDEKQKKLLSLHLSLSSDDYICNLIESSLSTPDATAETKGGKVYFDGGVYFFDFKMQPLNEDDVAKVIKFKSDKKKIIYCVKASAEAAVLAENFLIEIKQISELYAILKDR